MESRNGMCPLKGDIHANGYVVLINEDWWGGLKLNIILATIIEFVLQSQSLGSKSEPQAGHMI